MATGTRILKLRVFRPEPMPGCFLFTNEPVFSTIGYNPLELQGKSIFKYCHPDDIEGLAACFEKCNYYPCNVTSQSLMRKTTYLSSDERRHYCLMPLPVLFQGSEVDLACNSYLSGFLSAGHRTEVSHVHSSDD